MLTGIRQKRHFIKFKLNHRKRKLFLCTSGYIAYKIKIFWTKRNGDDPERCCGEGGRRGVHVWECMQELKILKFKKEKRKK